MRQFAFIIHPLDVNLVSIAFNEPTLLNKKYALVKKAFEWMPSFKCSEVTGVKSKCGFELKGNLIYFSLLPEQIVSSNQDIILERLISTSRIAEDIGADILGLGAYVAQIGKKGVNIAKNLNIPVTTGTHYTIYIALQSVLYAADRIGLPIQESTVAIIGATGAIGRVCAEVFSEIASQLILVSRNQTKLESFALDLAKKSKARLIIEKDIKKALEESEIGIMATTTPEPLISVNELKPGSLICDISRPRNVCNKGLEIRKDVLVIDGGIVQAPGEEVDIGFYFGLPKGLVYACMAETMILALEEKYENFSLGGEISYQKVKEIASLGEKHGFKLARIRSFDQEVPEEIFNKMTGTINKTAAR